MLADFIGDVVSSIVGDAIVGFLFPAASKPMPPPPEGEWNASLGSLAAFLAAVAAMFGGPFVFLALRGDRNMVLWPFVASSMIVAIVAGSMARRALKVTARRRALARLGLWLSRATLAAGVIAALASFAGVGMR
jgi:hypothetical protein